MQDHQKESNIEHQEIHPRDHTRNDRGIKDLEESPKNAETALRDMTTTGNEHNINIDTLKAGEDTISKTLAKLYTKCLSEDVYPQRRRTLRR